QSVRDVRITRDEVVEGFRHLVLDEDFIETIGPAINSGKSVFLYGHPGNGKTIIAEAIAEMFGGDLYVPHSILVEGDVVQVYDPVFHQLIRDDGKETGKDFLRSPDEHDQRFLHCERPVVIVGGELTLDQLELQHDPDTGVFRAPPQVKANGGVFVIDDFGRQRVRPRDLLNRWMYPLERQMDFLSLPTGQKLAVPFDTLLVFATNLNPADLVEEAFLRRIRYKIFVESPSKDQFAEIFRRTAAAKEIPFREDAIEFVYQNFYQKLGISPRKCHPRDLLNQIVDMSGYLDLEPEMSDDLLRRACHGYFMDSAMSMGSDQRERSEEYGEGPSYG
ncbi:MAG: ATP-binding protein, partial [Gemmatimonadota bacterium]|nr:ATP-binding protein [Gemmatimonadota bacterium]